MRYARSFVTRNPIHYIGHNPLGALMVFALLLFVSLTVWSGLKVYAIEGKGPLAQEVNLLMAPAYAEDEAYERGSLDKQAHHFWKDVHEFFANFTLFLVIVHIIGAVLASIVHGENLIKAMVTGRRECVESETADPRSTD
jgi:cytochrome b